MEEAQQLGYSKYRVTGLPGICPPNPSLSFSQSVSQSVTHSLILLCLEWDTEIDTIFFIESNPACMVVCLYDAHTFSTDNLLSVMSLHTNVVIGAEELDNYYHTAITAVTSMYFISLTVT